MTNTVSDTNNESSVKGANPAPSAESTSASAATAASTATAAATKPDYKRLRHRKVCQFCKDKITYIDYKDVNRLRRFINDRGKIINRRTTGTCNGHQKMLTKAIKRARNMALLPFTII